MSHRYKCIIAEDERRMADLVRLLGHWDEHEIEIVDVCYNGIDALDSIIKNKPDLVVTDIKMPGYDGLALIEKCQENNIDCAFIIVSGYKHFEYAKSAMQYGVVDYILKPIDEEQLNNAINKSIQIIKDKNQTNIIKTQRDEYFDKYNNIKYSDFWKQLFLSAYYERTFDLNKFKDLLPSDIDTKAYRIICIKTSIDDLLDKNSLFREKLSLILKGIESSQLKQIYQFSRDGIYILLKYEDSFDSNINQIISNIYYSLRNLTEIFDDFDLSFGYSDKANSVDHISQAMTEALSAETSKLIYGANKIISFEMIQNLPRFSSRKIINDELLEKLKNAYEYLKVNAIYDLHKSILNSCENVQNHHPWDMVRFQQTLVDVTLSLFMSEADDLETIKLEIYERASRAYRFVDFIRLTLEAIEEWFENYLLEQKQIHILPTEKAINFIETHYAESITLEEVSEHVGLSPTYFSKIFKNELGKGYAEYLAELRIEKSKKLLAETTESVKEISALVGYPDQKYFSKLFRKITGIKPSEYRKLYS